MFKSYNEFLSLFLILLIVTIGSKSLSSSKKDGKSNQRFVDPCKDFNRFVCGQNRKPGLFEEMTNSMFNIGKRLISQSNENYSTKLRNFYKSCINLNRIKRKSLNSFKYWYQEFIAKYKERQTLGRTIKEQFQSQLEFFKSQPPFHQLFTLATSINSFDTVKNIPQISRPQVYLIQSLLKEKNQTKLEIKRILINKQLIKWANVLGESLDENDALNMMKFEYMIDKLWGESSELGFEQITLKDLRRFCPAFDWDIIWKIYHNVADLAKLKPVVIQMTSAKSVIKTCKVLEYYMNSKESFRIVENYFKWTTIFSMLELVKTFRSHHEEHLYFENILTDFSYAKTTKQREPKRNLILTRENFCLQLANQYFPLSLTSLYSSSVKNVPQQQQGIIQIFQNLTENLRLKIKSSFWLTGSDKDRLVEKIDSMRINIFYPEVVADRKFILIHEKSIKINKNDFFNNMINAVKFNYKNNLKSLLNGPLNEYFTGFEINAYYIFQRNQINVPMGIIQGPIFQLNMSNVEKYSKIGFIIGHEISHGFDSMGIHFDSKGNLKDLLGKTSLRKFKERTSCFVEKYNEYNLPGGLELGENIADNTALEISYMSFKKTGGYVNKFDNQMFFFGYAKMFCNRPRKDGNTRILTDLHSPDKYRILGPTSNSKTFESAYHCERKNKIKEKKKCHLW